MSEATEQKGDKKQTSAQLWLGRLGREQKAHKGFRARAKIAMEAAQTRTGDTDDKGKRGYPIWWSNLKITQAAVYNRQPKPDVRRRVADSKFDKNIALAVERSIAYQQDTTLFDDHSTRAVSEFLCSGLGQTRLYLRTETEQQPVTNPVDGSAVLGEDGEPIMQDVITAQYVPLAYVPWDLFFWEPCKDWDNCTWVGFGRWLSRRQIEEEFGVDVGKGKGSDGGYDSEKVKKPTTDKYDPLLLVVEFHDKQRREIVTVCQGFSEVLKREPDKYKLKDFFPCPRPMMMNILSGELTPNSEYFYIQGMCEEIDRLTERARGIIKGIKDVGFYDSSFQELAELMENGDGARIPVNGLIPKLKGTRLENVMITEDIRSKTEVLVQLVAERERAKMELFELTGIADIVRGASKASETATAQTLKSNWANVRLSDKNREIALHFRTVFRLMGELICEHFKPEQITAQTGIEITPEMLQTMQSDLSRCYAIDIESDSTIAQDEAQEKSDRAEFLEAFTNFMATVMPLVSQGIMSADVANAALLFLVRGFRHGRILEEQIEQMPGTLQQMQGLQTQVQEGQQAQEQSTAQMQQMQAQAQQQAQEAQKALEDLQQQAQAMINEQQATIDQQAQKMAQLEQQVSLMKQVETMAKTRDIDAAADLKAAQAQKLKVDAIGGVVDRLNGGGQPEAEPFQ